MKIERFIKISKEDLPKDSKAEVHLIIVKITDLAASAKEMIKQISDTTWLINLELMDQVAYGYIVSKTAEKLISIFESIENEITKEFGEYFTALNAQNGLEIQHGHIKIPLSELWKEKVSNNPGFDFHTISQCEKIVFGESKYLTNKNAYGTALEQVVNFNLLKKDNPDIVHLNKFIKSKEPIDNFIKGTRAYGVAFSVNPQNSNDIEISILQNKHMIELCQKVELLYLIGVVYEPSKT